MNTQKLGMLRSASGAGIAALAIMGATPTTAFAAGPDILVPKPAEFIPALVAFLAIWAILAKVAWPMIIQTLDARQEKIEGDLAAASEAKEAAEAGVRESQERIAAAQNEAAGIVAAAKRSRIIAEAQASAVEIIAKAHSAVDAEREKAMVELSGQVVDLSVEIASKIIGEALDKQEQYALAEKYLLEVGSLNDE